MGNDEGMKAIQEMLQVWDQIEAAARQQHPNATEQEVRELTQATMGSYLGLKNK